MRLIDADLLVKYVQDNSAPFRDEWSIFRILTAIDFQPTVTDPFLHGRWHKRTPEDALPFVVCSICMHAVLTPSNYCSNCGAKMDKEEETP